MMKTKFQWSVILTLLAVLVSVPAAQGQSTRRWFVDFEAGSVFPGYCDVRILEGGDDNDRVYNFALFNYILVGVTAYF